MVEEGNLHVQVSVLRKLFGPSAIVTIPGRGYQFNPRGPLVSSSIDGGAPAVAPAARAEAPPISNAPTQSAPLVFYCGGPQWWMS